MIVMNLVITEAAAKLKLLYNKWTCDVWLLLDLRIKIKSKKIRTIILMNLVATEASAKLELSFNKTILFDFLKPFNF
jgi:hypothetical protein